jgi:phenylalanyl-tRNA synthetase beta chain
MHAFDLATLAGPEIRVRRARDKEPIATIDGERRTLDETMLVIADRDRAIAVAGVMGGLSSEISAGTTRVALESAWFVPNSVRATSKKLGLKTDASMRFERGADLDVPVRALQRAIGLLREIAQGAVDGGITDVYPRPLESREVTLGRDRLARLLGVAIPDADVERLLTALGFRLDRTASGWRALIPSFRVDVSGEADLIEEVGRHWGFDRIPATFPALRAMPRVSDAVLGTGRLARRILSGAGLQEAVTFTFIEAQAAAPFAAATALLPIKNPLSEKFAVLRPSLVPGLAEALVYNRNRQAADVRLFELGSVFSKDAGERVCVGWVMTGSRGEHWSGSAGSIEFTDTKGIAELVARAFGVGVDVRPAPDLGWLAPGAGAHLLAADGRPIGWIGRLAAVRGSDADVYAGEMDLDLVGRARERAPGAIRALPRFPAVVRDLSIFIDERLPAAEVRGTIRSHAPATLVAVGEFDRYRGKGVPPGRVSLSLRLTFQDAERTLTDTEVQAGIDAIVAALAGAHGAELRGR